MNQYPEAQLALGRWSFRTNKRCLYPTSAYEFATDRFIVLKDSDAPCFATLAILASYFVYLSRYFFYLSYNVGLCIILGNT